MVQRDYWTHFLRMKRKKNSINCYPNWRSEIVDINVECRVLFATEVVFASWKASFKCRTIVIHQNKFFFVDVLVRLIVINANTR